MESNELFVKWIKLAQRQNMSDRLSKKGNIALERVLSRHQFCDAVGNPAMPN